MGPSSRYIGLAPSTGPYLTSPLPPLTANSSDEEPVSDCKDYVERPGVCTEVLECKFWLNILDEGPNKTQRDNMRDSFCPLQPDDSTKICCIPSLEPTTTTTTTQRPTLSPTIPTTTLPPRRPEQHPNRRLLPADNACGITTDAQIVGGEAADIGEYPWLAILGYEGEWICVFSL